jgi:hypothetical protein
MIIGSYDSNQFSSVSKYLVIKNAKKSKYLCLIFFLVLTSCSLNKSIANSTLYKSPLGDVYTPWMQNKWGNVPNFIKTGSLNGEFKEILKAYVYFVENEPDPTLRPQYSFRSRGWLGVCDHDHPYDHRCEQRSTLPKNILFPQTDKEIKVAEGYFSDLAKERAYQTSTFYEYNNSNIKGLKSIANRLKDISGTPLHLEPPEFERSTGYWLDVCHPRHKKYNESCHVVLEINAWEKTVECAALKAEGINEEIARSIRSKKISKPGISITWPRGSWKTSMERQLARNAVQSAYGRCLLKNWNSDRKYLYNLSKNR